MLAFCWVSTRRLSQRYDLGPCGWSRLEPPATLEAGDGFAILAEQRWIPSAQRLAIAEAPTALRARILFVGVDSSSERAALLAAGYGDAVSGDTELEELGQRALRLLRGRDQAALIRRAGPVLLDLPQRDGWVEGRRLALHPLEFALLWRLAENPGEVVGRARLLREVWRIAFDPGTNRVEVHISRLRRKLAAARITGLVETAADGGYRVAAAPLQAAKLAAGPMPSIARTGMAERGAAAP